MRYYPIYLDLAGRAALVVGGGEIAEGKALQLLDAGARVNLVSPDLTPPLAELAARGKIRYRKGRFAAFDLLGASIVISATNDRETNEAVARLAAERRVLFNAVDQPGLCQFITPALVTRGRLQISISSSGGSPSVAQRVKREISSLIGDEYGQLLELAAELRTFAKERLPALEQRKELLRAFVESEALDLLREGREDEARALGLKLLSSL
jgi:precorrin-2 dehydrogenase/sirohydrochlorin ferrochelatase